MALLSNFCLSTIRLFVVPLNLVFQVVKSAGRNDLNFIGIGLDTTGLVLFFSSCTIDQDNYCLLLECYWTVKPSAFHVPLPD